jgi:hypothetical protein
MQLRLTDAHCINESVELSELLLQTDALATMTASSSNMVK